MFVRRFRFGGKKEAAGAAVAVISEGIMDFEYDLDVWCEVLWAVFSPLRMEDGEGMAWRGAIGCFRDDAEHGDGAVLSAARTLVRRRAGSKPSARVGSSAHEVSKPAKWSSTAVKRSTTRMAFPQRGQCHGAQSGGGGGVSGSRPC